MYHSFRQTILLIQLNFSSFKNTFQPFFYRQVVYDAGNLQSTVYRIARQNNEHRQANK